MDLVETQSDINKGIDVNVLRQTTKAVEADRNLGKFTFEVQGTWAGGVSLESGTGAITQAGVRDESRVNKFSMKSDEPPALLGDDTDVSPSEYVLQALAACYTASLAMKAADAGITLRAFNVQVEGDFDVASFLEIAPEEHPGASQIRINVDIDAPEASREQLAELVAVVERRSPIRDTLARPVDVVTTLL
ncbi:OsmC family protein [Glutamicibacter sp. AGC46]|uniref:OsmC family protein n=1 Tax=Glutamicibacter sp. 2E12 TaxID=3416181 RepID=UPI003CEFA9A3